MLREIFLLVDKNRTNTFLYHSSVSSCGFGVSICLTAISRYSVNLEVKFIRKLTYTEDIKFE